MNTIIQKIY